MASNTGLEWIQCPANARHVDELGHENVVVCDETVHGDPSDNTLRHYDETLDIYWQYAEGYDRDE